MASELRDTTPSRRPSLSLPEATKVSQKGSPEQCRFRFVIRFLNPSSSDLFLFFPFSSAFLFSVFRYFLSVLFSFFSGFLSVFFPFFVPFSSVFCFVFFVLFSKKSTVCILGAL